MVRRVLRGGVAGALGCVLGLCLPARADETAPPLEEPAGLTIANQDAAVDADDAGMPEPMRLSMEFQDANLKDVLKVFSQQTGLNVITGGDAGDQPVTLYLENVTVLDALDQILRVSNLTYERPLGSDIYIVKSKPTSAAGQTETRVYRLRYARVSKSNLAKAAAAFGESTPFEAVLKSEGDEEGGGGSTGAVGGGGRGKDTVGIDVVLENLLTPQGSISVDGRTNSLVLTDTPANFPRLEAALAALDIRTRQIVIDAELIETTISKLKDLGIEWGTGAEGELVTFNPSATGRQTRFPFNLFGDGMAAPSTVSGSQGFPTSTLSFGSFDGVLQALETDTDTKILARPKVLTLDNESAVIRLTTNQATGAAITTAAGGAGNTSTEVERHTTGVVMVVTPQINDDDYITMLVEPSVTRVVTASITPPAALGTVVDPRTRSARAMVRIRSGDTLVLGGLIDRSDQKTMRSVPVLSGIPFLGEAFKNKEINDAATELIVFVTPTILQDASAAQMAAVGQGPLGLREQESGRQRQDTIEDTLNTLETPNL